MFVTVDQSKKIIEGYLKHSGRGGFMTGTVTGVAPLALQTEAGFPLTQADLYVTDSCIGLLLNLTHTHQHDDTETDGAPPTAKATQPALRDQVVLRRPLAPGDGVLLLCRPDRVGGVKYILIDRIQPYMVTREVDTV